jgi:HK97 family phage major capsid protein
MKVFLFCQLFRASNRFSARNQGRVFQSPEGETPSSEASDTTFGQTEITMREVNTCVDISNQLLADMLTITAALVLKPKVMPRALISGLSWTLN